MDFSKSQREYCDFLMSNKELISNEILRDLTDMSVNGINTDSESNRWRKRWKCDIDDEEIKLKVHKRDNEVNTDSM